MSWSVDFLLENGWTSQFGHLYGFSGYHIPFYNDDVQDLFVYLLGRGICKYNILVITSSPNIIRELEELEYTCFTSLELERMGYTLASNIPHNMMSLMVENRMKLVDELIRLGATTGHMIKG